MVYSRISCKSARKERVRMGERKEKGWEKEWAGREGRKAKERGLNLSLCSFKILSPPVFCNPSKACVSIASNGSHVALTQHLLNERKFYRQYSRLQKVLQSNAFR